MSNPLRKLDLQEEGLPVAYSDEVSDDQVRRIDDLVRPEFDHGEWVTVESES